MQLIVNKKYVPHSKSVGKSLEYSAVWKKAKERNQPYLYYTGYDDGVHCFNNEPYEDVINGDWFLPTDVTEAVEIFKDSGIYKGSIVVSLYSISGRRDIGDMFEVLPNSYKGVLYYHNFAIIIINWDPNEWRLATPEEAEAYRNGIKNINQMKQKEKTNNMESKVQCQLVENEFILQAHKAACSDWKYKIETKFPDLFKTSAIERAIEKVGTHVYNYTVKSEGQYVLVPLPNANRDWSLEAFKYVKEFIAAYPESYPVHYSGVKNEVNFDTSEYIYIDFSSYLR